HEAAASDAPMRLLYSSRTRDEVIARERLVEHRARGIGVEITLTRQAPEDWDGRIGRVDGPMLEAATFAAAERPLMFICGPTAFVERVAELAVAMGHAPNMIKTERFGG